MKIGAVKALVAIALGISMWLFAALLPAADAASLKSEGDALMDARDYPGALAKYQEAFRLSSDPALLYNQGRALELMGRFPDALEILQRFDAKASPELHEKVPNLKQLLEAIEGQTCMLTVKVSAPGAATIENITVRLGDMVVGNAVSVTRRVNAEKRAHLEITADGFEPFSKDLELPGKGDVQVDAPLNPTDKTAVLRVVSEVKGASVSIDGKAFGQVPAEARLVPGSHTVLVSADGYADKELTIELTKNDRRTEKVELAAPLYKQWWFWTINVAVAGGAAAGISYWVLNTERSPDVGTIPPCTKPVGLRPQAADTCDSTIKSFAPVLPGLERGFRIGPVPVLRFEF